MSVEDLAQIYLISPPELDVRAYPDLLARTLDAADVACFRLALSSTDEDHIAQAADVVRDVCHARDIAVVIDRHALLVEKLGLDGVHLLDTNQGLRKLRTDMGEDVILGQYCGTSRHDGMSAGEAGADYVSFGPVAASSLGDGQVAEADLFAWWTEMIEVPVVAEGGLDDALIRQLADKVDFFAFGQEVWTTDAPAETLNRLTLARQG